MVFPGPAVSLDQRRGAAEEAGATEGLVPGTDRLLQDVRVLFDRASEVHILQEGETKNRGRRSTQGFQVDRVLVVSLPVNRAKLMDGQRPEVTVVEEARVAE